jgi:DNA-binding response OmpR family regulator
MLTASGDVDDKVEGLGLGADDYLAKPFVFIELVARVRALGRRGAVLRPRRVQIAGLDVDFTARRIERDGVEVPLTAREWAVFEALFARRGQTLTYEHLLEVAWGEASPSAQASLEVIIGRLRRKLGPGGPSAIRTLRGVGYALVDEPS